MEPGAKCGMYECDCQAGNLQKHTNKEKKIYDESLEASAVQILTSSCLGVYPVYDKMSTAQLI